MSVYCGVSNAGHHRSSKPKHQAAMTSSQVLRELLIGFVLNGTLNSTGFPTCKEENGSASSQTSRLFPLHCIRFIVEQQNKASDEQERRRRMKRTMSFTNGTYSECNLSQSGCCGYQGSKTAIKSPGSITKSITAVHLDIPSGLDNG